MNNNPTTSYSALLSRRILLLLPTWIFIATILFWVMFAIVDPDETSAWMPLIYAWIIGPPLLVWQLLTPWIYFSLQRMRLGIKHTTLIIVITALVIMLVDLKLHLLSNLYVKSDFCGAFFVGQACTQPAIWINLLIVLLALYFFILFYLEHIQHKFKS